MKEFVDQHILEHTLSQCSFFKDGSYRRKFTVICKSVDSTQVFV